MTLWETRTDEYTQRAQKEFVGLIELDEVFGPAHLAPIQVLHGILLLSLFRCGCHVVWSLFPCGMYAFKYYSIFAALRQRQLFDFLGCVSSLDTLPNIGI